MTFSRLDTHCRKLEAMEHALSMLRVDEAVMMPAGGGDKRAEAVATLAGMYHQQATAPEIADWIADAEAEDLNAAQKTALIEFRRDYLNKTCLPVAFVERQTAANMRSEQMWRALRPAGDWAEFLPALEAVVAAMREEAALRADVLGLAPYDALMEQYDPGNRAAAVAPVFDDLKRFLKSFIPEALEHQAQRRARRPMKPMNGPFPVERQRALGLSMMGALGFDFTHGRLDVSHHPFCGGVPTDVRMTTRYETREFLSALMGTLHETGHALYEQGLPTEWSHWPVGRARGMAIHESQSLFVEQQIARSDVFWSWAMPHLAEHLGEDAVAGWDLEDMLAHVHHVEPGFIRVDADEATYPLHVILRFEIEQELVSGALRPSDIPEAWNARMVEYLGLSTLDNPRDGAMQDVHWPAGAFGYFPSYTLGAMIAAQQWAALEASHPGAREDIARGDFTAINAWRRTQIWQRASTLSTPDLLVAATGEPLSARFFEAHLRRRYLG
ncbi:carboxypeptidase M32 [Arsenicitalea aurantiaca]|uniref:Metal-dependent carboxypeptidase n=1 Tax=Arsenicitalea aurantiaca TaxID=1783274 RepID=A0A433XG98_9HYPH|nr:carboxypeptidase M32 [Arsenicitalea aurantiaca]RUT33129.1 carboxypeptidase M32 [Arsenicitalea aurantiaca]